ncbi:MAG: hypothetical protein ACRDZV_17595 [Acidimicrobiia bacterium]
MSRSTISSSARLREDGCQPERESLTALCDSPAPGFGDGSESSVRQRRQRFVGDVERIVSDFGHS